MIADMKFKAMVFDLDGTLLDTLPDLIVVTNTALDDFGFPKRSGEEIHRFVGNGARALIWQALPQDGSHECVDEIMAHWKGLYARIGTTHTKAYPHMSQTLIELKSRGIRLGVLSNKFDEGVQDVIAKFFPNIFDVIHGESEEIPRKPNPAGLLRTIEELGSTPEQTIYVGDSPGDVRVSRDAGTFSLGVGWGYHAIEEMHEAHADAVICDVRELLRFV